MTSGKKLDRETVNYLRALPEIVRCLKSCAECKADESTTRTPSGRKRRHAMPWETGPSTSSATTG